MAITTWIGVNVSMSNTLGAPTPITAISKAASAVCSTGSTTGISVGSYVLLTAQGMGQVNGRVFRVAAFTANASFTLESVNSTNFDTFSSGSWQLVTFPNTLSQLTNVSSSGGEYDKIDSTLLSDTNHSSIPGMGTAVEYTFDAVWDSSDAGLLSAADASDMQDRRCFQIKFKNNQRLLFAGYVGAGLNPGGSMGQMVTTKVTISANGGIKAYAS